MDSHRIEYLPNGFIRIDHRGSGLVSVLNADGTRRSGVKVPASVVAEALAEEATVPYSPEWYAQCWNSQSVDNYSRKVS